MGKMECGALSSMKDELKLDFSFTIRADLLACTEENIYLVREQPSTWHCSSTALICTHSEYLHTGG